MSKSEADPRDVESIDAIITAAYDVISGPAGKKRDWDRERSLYYPGARLIPTAKPGANDGLAPQILDVEGLPLVDRKYLLAAGKRSGSNSGKIFVTRRNGASTIQTTG